MKRTILFAIIAVMAGTVHGQSEKFTSAMTAVLMKTAAVQTFDERQAVANSFARIAEAEKNEWTPLYYAALNNLVMSFMDISAEQKGKLITLAQKQIDAGLELRPEETELMVLKMLSYYGQMALNPMDAMTVMGEVSALTDLAKSINPGNPRIYLAEAEAVYNTPPEFGGGPEAARPLLTVAMEKFNNFVPVGLFAPDWGRDRCEMLLRETEPGR
jgi:hypothetical protein